MAASATFALNAGVCVRRARLLIVSPDSRVNLARRQAETPLREPCRFPEPALLVNPNQIQGLKAVLVAPVLGRPMVGLWRRQVLEGDPHRLRLGLRVGELKRSRRRGGPLAHVPEKWTPVFR